MISLRTDVNRKTQDPVGFRKVLRRSVFGGRKCYDFLRAHVNKTTQDPIGFRKDPAKERLRRREMLRFLYERSYMNGSTR